MLGIFGIGRLDSFVRKLYTNISKVIVKSSWLQRFKNQQK